jgi:hypothetical protein
MMLAAIAGAVSAQIHTPSLSTHMRFLHTKLFIQGRFAKINAILANFFAVIKA